MSYQEEETNFKLIIWFGIVIVAFLIAIIGGCMTWGPVYKVWHQKMEGEAELARADQNRQIAVKEAEAKRDSASKLAEAEILRAKGVSEANKIIAESLKGNESYLRYLWVTEVAANETGKTTVYIPTEANMPILEAGKREVNLTKDKNEN